MFRAGTGETLGKRPPLLALAVVRVFIASVTLLQGRLFAGSETAAYFVQGALIGWAALSLAGLFLNLPRSRWSFLVMLVLDWLFAIGIMLFGAPIAGLLLLLFDEIVLRACGWRWAPAIAMLPYGLLLVSLRFTGGESLGWSHFDIVQSDIFVWATILALYAITLQLAAQRRTSLERLGGDIWIDPILAADQPFSYNFDKWIEQLSGLFGGSRGVCLLALTQRAGPLRVFSNTQPERFELELAKALGPVRKLLPHSLAVVRDREMAGAKEDKAIAQLHLLAMLDHSVIMARHFRLGMQHGILVIAHNLPNDAILSEEATVIDRALDDVLDRITRTMEMRRAFLAEAREVARRDLHDGVLQSLAALRMRLLTIIQSKDVTPETAAEIRNTAEIIALEQARLRTLLDKTVDEDQAINLVEALRLGVKTTALQWEVEIEFDSDKDAIPMHRESANNVEYLLREVIANATKHSGSKHMRCALALSDDNLTITLMDLSATPAKLVSDDVNGPLASHSLRQRLALVNGRAYSEGLQTGTLLAIAIPLIYDENDL